MIIIRALKVTLKEPIGIMEIFQSVIMWDFPLKTIVV